jgi:tyrosinase
MDYIEQPENPDRRIFVKGVGFVSLGLVTTTLLGGCEALIEQIRNRPVRRRLRTGSPDVDNSIAIYKDAVTKMQALPASNPRSWAAQAAIHGNAAGFNFCQHGTDHFFSWHRAYLFYFEKICQELTGEKSFGLPYWNWGIDPAMHPAFTAAGSPLNHPRNNTSVAGNPAFTVPQLNGILSDSNFFTFSSQVEGTPHNTVHDIVGLDMVTGGSPVDPVFWPHHCMVDYIWAKWNIELNNANTNDAGWLHTSWDHFVDGKGNPTSITAGTTLLMPFLSYRYESSAVGGFDKPFDLATSSARDLRRIENHIREGADVRFDTKLRIPISGVATLLVARPFSAQTRLAPADFSALLESDAHKDRVFLSINYVQLPANNDFFVRAFVNLPNANEHTPTDDIHFAGSFAFFGTDTDNHGAHRHKTDFLVNLTDTLRRLIRAGAIRADQPLSVQLVASPVVKRSIPPEMQLTLKGIDLIVSSVRVHATQEK